jgi:hypothetical protein
MQELKLSEAHSIALSCSSIYQSTCPPENILNYNDKEYFWFSDDQKDQWICIKFSKREFFLLAVFLAPVLSLLRIPNIGNSLDQATL